MGDAAVILAPTPLLGLAEQAGYHDVGMVAELPDIGLRAYFCTNDETNSVDIRTYSVYTCNCEIQERATP
jgi:hypothetical protein